MSVRKCSGRDDISFRLNVLLTLFVLKPTSVFYNERPEINAEWPDTIKGMLESSFDKDIDLRPKASLFYDIIRDELKRIRGNAKGLNDTWIQRRRSDLSLKGLFSEATNSDGRRRSSTNSVGRRRSSNNSENCGMPIELIGMVSDEDVMSDEDEEDNAPLNFQRLADLCKQVASDSATSTDACPSSHDSLHPQIHEPVPVTFS